MRKEDEVDDFCGVREEGTNKKEKKRKTRRKRELIGTDKTSTGGNGDDRELSADRGEPGQSTTTVGALSPTAAPAGDVLRSNKAERDQLEEEIASTGPAESRQKFHR